MTTRQEQAEFKSWLDGIVEPHPEQWAERQAQINARRGANIPKSEKQLQAQRVWDFVRLVEEGKFASAAHVRREWKKHNPWLNGVETEKTRRLNAIYEAQQEELNV
jgi:hypothetical protein